MGQAISLIGDRVALIALVFLVIHLSSGYAPALSLFYVARVVPTLAAGLFAGYISDAVDRKQLMIACDVVRCVLVGLVPILTSFDLLLVYPIVVLLYGMTVLFNATARAMLPDVVPDSQVLQANTVVTRVETGADLAYAAGGFLIAYVRFSLPFYIDAATFAVSAAAISLMHIPSPRQAVATSLREMGERIREGIVYLLQQPFLKWSTISSAIAPLTIGGVFVVSPLYASRILGHSTGLFGPLHSGAFRFGVLEISIGIGGLIGTWITPALANRWTRGRLFGLGMAGFGLVVASLTLVTNMYVAVMVMALSGVCNSLFVISGSTLLQTLTPSEMRGRVIAARMTVIQTGLALGSAIAGVLLVRWPLHTVWLVLGLCMLLGSGFIWIPSAARNQG